MAESIDGRDSEVLELTEDALVDDQAVENDALAISIAEPAASPSAPTTKAKTSTAKSRREAKREEARAKKEARAEAKRAEQEEADVTHAGFGDWFRHHMNESSGFAASLVVHMALLIILVLLTLPKLVEVKVDLVAAPAEKFDELAEIPELDVSEPIEPIDPTEIVEQPETTNITEDISFSPFDDAASAAASMQLADFGMNSAPEMLTNSISGFDGSGLKGRGQASRNQLVRIGGGTEASEEAVAKALAWLIEHQNPDGTWSLDHTGGKCQGRCGNPGSIRDSLISGTALAVLPFLGAGQTHKEGKYKVQVEKALDALVRLGEATPNGVEWMDGGNLYAHGLASIAICEAYAMTDDYRLMQPAQASLNFIVYAQDPSLGGWRYTPRQGSDTSVVGWQLMALKSGYMGKLNVPNTTIKRASEFLDAVSTDYGEGYAYVVDNKRYKASTSAVGLLCRMYTGWKKDHETLQAGVERLAKIGPSDTDFYYNYYANQVLFQYTGGQGPMWRDWNTKLRDFLVAKQSNEGHEKGSWYVRSTHASTSGGRLYMTAMGAMTLEIYYRHMPIYGADSVEVEFPE